MLGYLDSLDLGIGCGAQEANILALRSSLSAIWLIILKRGTNPIPIRLRINSENDFSISAQRSGLKIVLSSDISSSHSFPIN